jgi:hypothetical protein
MGGGIELERGLGGNFYLFCAKFVRYFPDQPKGNRQIMIVE